jgi:hypothetical protein
MANLNRARRRAEKRRESERARLRHLKRRLRDTYGIYRLKRSELFVVYRHYYDFWSETGRDKAEVLPVDHTGGLNF